MRKILLKLLLAGVVLSFTLPAAADEEVTIGKLVFRVGTNWNGAKFARVTGFVPGITEAVIPSSVRVKTSTDDRAYDYAVTSVGGFKDCTTLTSFQWLDLEQWVIDGGYGCVLSFGCFEGCTNLTEVRISGQIRVNGSNAFKNCTSLKNITIPVLDGTSHTFENCSNLEEVTVLQEYNSGTDPSRISEYAFAGCTKLKRVNFPPSTVVGVIEKYAFDGCESFEEIQLLNKVSYIGNSAFQNCKSLKEVDLTWIISLGYEGDVFPGCTNLETVNIGSEATYVFPQSFGDCPNLKAINVAEGNSTYCSVNGSLYSKDLRYCYLALPRDMKKFIIPEGVARAEYCFRECNNLEFISFPKTFDVLNSTPPDKVKTIICKGWWYTGSHLFKSTTREEGTVYVYAPNLSAYRENVNWRDFKNILPLRDGNRDGVVDVVDLNIALNLVLQSTSKEDYPGMLTDSDEKVDIELINEVINQLLTM